MDEIIRAVARRTGISAGQARTAVDTVLDHVRGVLPPVVASRLEMLLADDGLATARFASTVPSFEMLFAPGDGQPPSPR